MAALTTALVLGLACLSVAAANYPNPIVDTELESVITSSIDPLFYKLASEVGTDKVWDHRYDFVYRYQAALHHRQRCCQAQVPGLHRSVLSSSFRCVQSVAGACSERASQAARDRAGWVLTLSYLLGPLARSHLLVLPHLLYELPSQRLDVVSRRSWTEERQ